MAEVRASYGLAGALFVSAVAAFAAPPVPQGSEIAVNSYVTESQRAPSAAMDATGRFVVVWESYQQDGDTGGIFGQRFSETGQALGSEFQIADSTATDQTQPAVAMNAAGGFVVVWKSDGQDGDDGGIFARIFDESGSPQTGEMLVNPFTIGDQALPAVAIDGDGDFVVVWDSLRQFPSSRRLLARRFDSAGGPLSGELIVNGISTGPPLHPSVAMRADGGFIVVWQSHEAEDDDDDVGANGVLARRFDSAGSPLSAPTRVNSFTASEQQRPSVAVDPAGAFVVVWESLDQDSKGWGVFGQRFTSSGAAAGGEFVAPTFTDSDQRLPSVAKDASGDFVVTWQSYRMLAEYQIGVQRFAASGTRDGGELLANTFTAGTQDEATLAMAGDGTFIVAWDSTYHQDGDGSGVFARRFLHTTPTPSPTVTATATATPTATPTGTLVVADTSTPTQTPSPSASPTQTMTPSTTATPTATASATATSSATVTPTATETPTSTATASETPTITATATQTTTPTPTSTPTMVLPTLDVDGNGSVTALTDGILVLRHRFGLTGTALVASAVGPGCTRCDGAAVAAYLDGLGLVLDVDGNGTLGALTDGILVLRFLFGLNGTALTSGVVGAGCTRCDAEQIAGYLTALP